MCDAGTMHSHVMMMLMIKRGGARVRPRAMAPAAGGTGIKGRAGGRVGGCRCGRAGVGRPRRGQGQEEESKTNKQHEQPKKARMALELRNHWATKPPRA